MKDIQRQIIRTTGAVVAENLLLDVLRNAIDSRGSIAADHPQSIGKTTIVVPSSSLASHLRMKIVQALGGSSVGIEVVTAWALAKDIAQKGGQRVHVNPPVFSIIVQEQAQRISEIKKRCDSFENGYVSLLPSCSDLLSAGIDEDSYQTIMRQDLKLSALERGMITLAMKVKGRLKTLNAHRQADVYQLAASVLQKKEFNTSLGELYVTGFADATGQALFFLHELLKYGAIFFVDEPPKLFDLDKSVNDTCYSARFIRRLISDRQWEEKTRERKIDTISALDGKRLRFFNAATLESEVQRIIWDIRDYQELGGSLDDICILSQSFSRYWPVVDKLFSQYGIALRRSSTLAEYSPCYARIDALLKLNADGMDTSIADMQRVVVNPRAWNALSRLNERIDNLSSLCRLDVERYEDPIAELMTMANALKSIFEEKDISHDNLSGWVKRLKDVADAIYFGGFAGDSNVLEAFWDEVERNETLLCFEIEAESFYALAKKMVAALIADMKREWTGVTVVDSTHFRGMTFEKLYVMGANRGVFPRKVEDDPLLSETLRKHLETILPDLSPKERGWLEEEYSFAQLVSSANDIVFSWQRMSRDGTALNCAAFVERLMLSRQIKAEVVRREPFLLLEEKVKRATSSHDYAAYYGLSGNGEDLAQDLRFICADNLVELKSVNAAMDCVDSDKLALAWANISIEQEPLIAKGNRASHYSKIGPYLGQIGSSKLKSDPRNRSLYITTVEKLARCPWQYYLRRFLKLNDLPGEKSFYLIDPKMLGNCVHDSLARLLGKGRDRKPQKSEIEGVVGEVSAELCKREKLNLKGLVYILQQKTIPYINRAIELSFSYESDDAFEIVEAESERTVEYFDESNTKREIKFRVDRVDRVGDKERLIDYKTGSAPDFKKTEKAKMEQVIKGIKRGERLQGALYASTKDAKKGCYYYLDPKIDDQQARYCVDSSLDMLNDVLPKTLAWLTTLWDKGLFIPRLEEKEKEPNACSYCDVAAACWRNDSSVRGRLREIANGDPFKQSDIELLFKKIWFYDEKAGE